MAHGYTIPDEAEEMLRRMSDVTGLDNGALLSSAISLLDTLVAAKLDGEVVMIADAELDLGFGVPRRGG